MVMMHFIASRGKQSQLGGQNWFDNNTMTRNLSFSSLTVDLELQSVLSNLEINSSGTQGIFWLAFYC